MPDRLTPREHAALLWDEIERIAASDNADPEDCIEAIEAAFHAAVAEAEAERDAALRQALLRLMDGTEKTIANLSKIIDRLRDPRTRNHVASVDVQEATEPWQQAMIRVDDVLSFDECGAALLARAKALATALERIEKKGGDAR